MMRWPTQCAVCRGWSTQSACKRCVERFAPVVGRCRHCALPCSAAVCGACLRSVPPFNVAITAVDYQFPWDGLIARLKFRQGLDLAPMFSVLLARAVRSGATRKPALVLPVPLGLQRMRERGYNQAWELARRVAVRLGCQANPDLLLRTVDTPHQSSLPRERRAANVRGSFALAPRAAERVNGQAVALVDDVMTTGATVAEASRMLLAAGATSVQVWVAARTPAPD